jgi:hypothetical protein
VTRESLGAGGAQRDEQHQRAALLMARYCSLLVAVWDGQPTAHRAGTARVVEFRRRGMMLTQDQAPLQKDVLLDTRDNDLMFEIRCARASHAGGSGAAVPELEVLGFSGHGTDAVISHGDLPHGLRRLLTRTAEFNEDSRAASEGIATRSWPLLPPDRAATAPKLKLLNQLFVQADFLGSSFRQDFLRAIKVRYSLWAAMATLLIAFKHQSEGLVGLGLICAVLAIFLAGRVHATTAQRRSWHRKYLDYRALAEALRVDYYWEITGVRHRFAGAFAHESFLQKQDTDLEWIRAAMRSVNVRLATHPQLPSPAGMAEVTTSWIGDDTPAGKGGQLHYYGLRSQQLSHRLHASERIDRVLLVVGLLLALTFLLDILLSLSGHHFLPEGPRHVLLWSLALLTVYAGIFEVYLGERADRTLIRQYRYMHTLFGHALRELRAARTEDGKLDVLRSLGQACLAEHAQWTLAQRDKTIQGLKW